MTPSAVWILSCVLIDIIFTDRELTHSKPVTHIHTLPELLMVSFHPREMIQSNANHPDIYPVWKVSLIDLFSSKLLASVQLQCFLFLSIIIYNVTVKVGFNHMINIHHYLSGHMQHFVFKKKKLAAFNLQGVPYVFSHFKSH